jgi:hypothetical protein
MRHGKGHREEYVAEFAGPSQAEANAPDRESDRRQIPEHDPRFGTEQVPLDCPVEKDPDTDENGDGRDGDRAVPPDQLLE